MYRKVPIRQLAKRLPLSPEFQKAAVLDEYGEAGVRQDLGAIIEGDRGNFGDVLTQAAKKVSDDLAEKYVTRPAAPPAAPQAEPRQQASHPAPATTVPFRPAHQDVPYRTQFAAARHRRASATK